MSKYIFYDLETSGRGKKEHPTAFGTTPKWEQIMQIAAIVTDSKFNQTNQNMNEFCRPRTSVISQPGALITTLKGMREALDAPQSSYELMKKINETFDEWKKDDPSSTFIGHNIIEFDESVLEYNLFSHMFYPYVTRKSRGDTLNLARGLYAINPSSIKTPLTERGNPSFKLEKIAEMNNLPVEFAHDAFSDVKTSIALTKYINEADTTNWNQLQMTMSKEDAIEYINKNKGFCFMTSFGGRIKLQALSMVCESQYNGWFHTIDLAHDPTPLLEANSEEFKKLIKRKNRYVITNQHPIILPGKIASNYEPYDEIGSDLLNERAKIVFKNKDLADKFKLMEIDRRIEKEDEKSQDNVFPESAANAFLDFKQSTEIAKFHEQNDWNEKYKIALSIKEPRANFILKRLIFDESPKTLSKEDFKMVHRELHERLVINQERPFTTIPEAMSQTDTELVKMEESDDEHKVQKMQILKDYNVYLNFMEKYFSNKNADPLPSGKELSKIIFG